MWTFNCITSIYRTYASFSIEGDVQSFEEVQQLVMERRETLADLGFEILELSQGMQHTTLRVNALIFNKPQYCI